MQISHVEVVPIELKLRLPHRAATYPAAVDRIDCVFVPHTGFSSQMSEHALTQWAADDIP